MLGGYLVLDVERPPDGGAPARPPALERPDTGLGPAPGLRVPVVGGHGRRLRARLLGVAARVPRAVARGRRRAAPRQPKKVRIWDEEDA